MLFADVFVTFIIYTPMNYYLLICSLRISLGCSFFFGVDMNTDFNQSVGIFPESYILLKNAASNVIFVSFISFIISVYILSGLFVFRAINGPRYLSFYYSGSIFFFF